MELLDDAISPSMQLKPALTWDLLKSSPDWEEYVPMKYGVFFSDPEVESSRADVSVNTHEDGVLAEKETSVGQTEATHTCVLLFV